MYIHHYTSISNYDELCVCKIICIHTYIMTFNVWYTYVYQLVYQYLSCTCSNSNHLFSITIGATWSLKWTIPSLLPPVTTSIWWRGSSAYTRRKHAERLLMIFQTLPNGISHWIRNMNNKHEWQEFIMIMILYVNTNRHRHTLFPRRRVKGVSPRGGTQDKAVECQRFDDCLPRCSRLPCCFVLQASSHESRVFHRNRGLHMHASFVPLFLWVL